MRGVVAVALVAAACASSPEPAAPAATGAWFEEVASERGLVFEHRSGHRTEFYMPEIMGGGAALFDMDGDGDLDVYLVNSGSLIDTPSKQPPNRLFENRGDGRFEDVTDGSGAGDTGYGMGVTAGDYDLDGDVDIAVGIFSGLFFAEGQERPFEGEAWVELWENLGS